MVNINVEGDVYDNNINFNGGKKGGGSSPQKLLNDIYEALITIQTRKHDLVDSEEKKNERLTDLLRSKGWYISDETRSGRSGSDISKGYKSGELDIAVRREKSGNIESIIEAFELDSCGPKNKIIGDHINKLRHCYDTAGNKMNFVVVYSKAKKFKKIWVKYVSHLKEVVFNDSLEMIKGEDFNKSKIKVVKTSVKEDDLEQVLIHMFVDMYVQ